MHVLSSILYSLAMYGYLLAGIICIKHGIFWRPITLLAQQANVSSESDGARYVIVLTSPFDVILEFKT